MISSFRRLVLVVSVLATALGVSACSSDSNNPDAPISADAPKADAGASAADAKPADAKLADASSHD